MKAGDLIGVVLALLACNLFSQPTLEIYEDWQMGTYDLSLDQGVDRVTGV